MLRPSYFSNLTFHISKFRPQFQQRRPAQLSSGQECLLCPLRASAISAFVFFLSIAALTVSPSVAQSTATLSGAITDPSGAVLAGIEIAAQPIASASSAVIRTATDASGRYSLALPSGRYRVRIVPGADLPFARVEREFAFAAGESRDWSERLAFERLSATVVVTAHAEPLPAQDSTASVSIVSRADMRQREEIWLAPLLSAAPGVTIAHSGRAGGITSLFLDGGNSNFTKVLVDGVPLNEPGGNVDLSNFSLDNVEKVEVVRGAESALFGTDAMSGVVQVFTRRGSASRPQLHLSAEGGSFSTARGAADLSGILQRFDYSLAAARFGTEGQEANDNFRATTLSGNFGYRFRDDNRIRLVLRSVASHAGAPGQALLTPAPNLDQYNALRNFTAGLAWEFAAGPRWQHRVSASETYIRQLFDNATSDFCDPNPPFLCDFAFTTHNRYNRAGFGAQSSYLVPLASVTFGYHYEVENGGISRGHVRRNNQGGYLDSRWTWRRLTLSGGFRVEANDNFGTRAVPRAGVAFALRDGSGFWGATRLRGSFGLGVKEPTFFQTFGFSNDPCFPGNLELRPEKSRTASFGFDQRLAEDRIRIVAEGFLNRFRDITSFTFCFPGDPCPVTPPPGCPFGFGTYFNTDLARANGANLALESRVTRWLNISGAYTFTDSRVLAAPNAFDPALIPGERLFRRPVHSGNIFFAVNARSFSGSFAGYFSGPRTDSDFLGLGFTRNPGYAKFDLAASYVFTRNLSAFVRVENLFDKLHQEVLGYRAGRRAFRTGLRFTFGGE
jgi:outer membrane cobalamin receptor